jgi:hypothetical protein
MMAWIRTRLALLAYWFESIPYVCTNGHRFRCVPRSFQGQIAGRKRSCPRSMAEADAVHNDG